MGARMELDPRTLTWGEPDEPARCRGVPTGVAAALVCIAGLGTGALSVMRLFPGVLLVLAMVQVFALAARVSDKCARASVLVNSCSEWTFGTNRMRVVAYT